MSFRDFKKKESAERGANPRALFFAPVLLSLFFICCPAFLHAATKVYLQDSASAINPGTDIEKDLTRFPGPGFVTYTKNTARGTFTPPTAVTQLTQVAAGTPVVWYSDPLDDITISGNVTFNIWAMESNAAANGTITAELLKSNNAGTTLSVIASVVLARTELSDTTMAAQNWSLAPVSTVLANGDRLAVRAYMDDALGVQRILAGYTITATLGGSLDGGNGDSWVQVTEALAPMHPAITAISGVYSSSITASWQLAGAATGYTLAASVNSANPPSPIAASSTTAGGLSASVEGLSPNTTYYLFVRANAPGASSSWAAYAATATLANVPVPDTFTNISTGAVRFNWLPNTNPAPGTLYRVKVSTASDPLSPGVGQVVTTSSTYNAYLSTPALSANTTYYFRVAAVNKNGVETDYTAAAATSTWANAPLVDKFTSISTGAIQWNWLPNANRNPGTRYRLLVSTAANVLSPNGAVVTTSDTYNLSLSTIGLAANTTYYFRTYGINNNGIITGYIDSSTSTWARDPVFDGFTNVSSGAVKYKWTGNYNPDLGTLYRVKVSTGNPLSPGVGQVVTTSNTYNISLSSAGLLPNTTYNFSVAGVNRNGVETGYTTVMGTATLLAFDPTFNSLPLVSTGSVQFNWNGLNPPGTLYRVKVSTAENPGVGQVVTTSDTYNVSLSTGGLAPNATYYFRVAGVNKNGVETNYTAAAGTSTWAVQPMTFNFNGISPTKIRLDWASEGNGPGTLYRVKVSTAIDPLLPGTGQVVTTSDTYNAYLSTPGLYSYTDYNFSVGAFNNTGVFTNYAGPFTQRTLPDDQLGEPVAVSVSDIYVTSMTANWLLVTNATGYTLAASVNPGNPPSPVFASSTTVGNLSLSASVFTPALSANTKYYLFVRANGNGVASTWANFPGVSTRLQYAPAFLSFTNLAADSVKFSWTDSNPGGIQYRVKVSTAPDPLNPPAGAVVTTSDTYNMSLLASGLNADTTYYFRVAGLNSDGLVTDYSAAQSTATWANTPSFLSFTGVAEGAMQLNWGPNGNRSPGTLYRVKASTASDPFSPGVGQVVTTSDTYNTYLNSTGLAANTTYYFRVVAINSGGTATGDFAKSTSTWANAPAFDTFTGVSTGSLRLNWLPAGNRSPGTLYRVKVSTAADPFSPGAGQAVTSSDTYNTYLSTPALAANTTYYFRVTAVNNNGLVSGDFARSTSTWANMPVFSSFTITAPGAVQLSWTVNGNRAPGTLYRVKVSTDPNPLSPAAGAEATTFDTYNVSLSSAGLAPNTTYHFIVAGVNNNGIETDYTAPAETSTLAALPVFGAFTNLTPYSLKFNWSAEGNPYPDTLYRVFASTAPDPLNPGQAEVITEDTYEPNSNPAGLMPATSYYFRVAGLNNNGVISDYSAPEWALTLNAPPSTKLYFQDSPASLGANTRQLTVPSGSALVTYTKNTMAGAVTPPTALTQFTQAAGGAVVTWYSYPLDAVDIAGNVTFNLWARESNFKANAAITAELLQADNAGNILSTISSVVLNRVEANSSALAMENWIKTPAPASLANGDRLAVRWHIDDSNGQTMATGYNVTATIGGATAGVSGDSWVRLTEGLAPARPALNALSAGNIDIYQMSAGWQLVEGATGYTLAASVNPDNPPFPINVSSTTLGDLSASLSLPALSPNTTYYLFARTNGWGASSSWAAYPATSTLLAYPPAFDKFTEVAADAVRFNWLHNGNAADTLYRVAVSTAPQPLAPGGAAATVQNVYGLNLASSALNANTTYYFNVAGLNNNGVATSSITLATSTLANAPDFNNFTSVSTGAIQFNWFPNGNRSPGTLYRVLVSSASDFLAPGGAAVTSSDTYNIFLGSAGLAANTTYYFRVAAVSNNGVVTGTVDASTSTWARAPVYDNFAEISTGSVKFNWLPDSSRYPGTLYRALVSTSASMSAATSQDTYGLSVSSAGLAANVTCYFRVTAINNNGIIAGAVNASTSTWARAPVFTAFTAISSGSVKFGWSEDYSRFPGTLFRVLVSSSADMSAATSSSTYNNYLSSAGLKANTTYYLNAAAINNNGVYTAYTGVQSTATLLAFNPAAGNFTGVDAGAIQFSWTDANPAGTLYRVKVSTSSMPFTPPPGAVVSSSDTYNLSLASSGLAANTTYFFSVVGLNHNGVPTSYTVAKGTSTWAVLPSALNFTGITPNAIRLNWTASGGPGTRYRVLVSTTDNLLSPGAGQVVTTSDTYNVYLTTSGLKVDTVYYFLAGAFNNNGIFAGYAGVQNATTLPTGGIGVPVIGAVSGVFVTSMTANWTLVSGATGYTLAASVNSGNPPSPVYSSSVTVGNLSVSASVFESSALSPNTTYYLFVKANGLDATSPWAPYPGLSTRLQYAPAFTNFTDVGANAVRFNWSDSNPAGTQYRVKVSTAPDPLNPPAGAVVTTSDTYNVSLSSSGLNADTTYYFRVAGLNNNGLATAYTAAQSTSALANSPIFDGFTGISTGSLRLNWLPNGNRSPGTLYRVLVSTSANFSAATSSNTYSLSLSTAGLGANATYYFRAAAVNSNGVITGAIDASTSTWARAPVFTNFTGVAENSMKFNWTDGGNAQAALYRVLVSTSGNMSAATSSDTYNAFLSTSGLVPNTTHYFRAAGVNNNGVETAYTLMQGTATLANLPLTAVSTFSGVAVTGFTAGWSRNSNPFGTTYTVQVSTAQDFNAGASNQVSASTAPAAGPSYAFAGLTFSTEYYFRVRAANYNGVYTEYAPLGSTRTLGLQAPVVGSITNAYAASIEAAWQLAESATGYTLAASVNPGNPPFPISASSTTVGGGALVYTPALTPDTTYYLFVRSNGPGESSPWAAYPEASTLANPPVAAGVTFSGVSFDRLTAAWGNNSNPLGGTVYTVELSTAPNFNDGASHVTKSTAPATGPDYPFEGLDPGTLYYFRVRAQHNYGGFTDWVSLGYAQTKAAVVVHNAGDGIVFYGQAGNTMPQFRRYISATNTFESAAATLSGAAGSLFVVKTSPLTTKQEAVAGYVKDGTLHVLCTDGNNWSEEWTQTVGGAEKTRRFDISYETNSGDVMVLYSRDASGAGELGYRTKPGSAGCDPASWSGNTTLEPAQTLGVVHWVKMASDRRAASDALAAIWADGNAYLSAMVWNGNAWENEPSPALETSLETVSAGQDVEDFDVEFESLTGDLVVAWAKSVGNATTNGVRVATAAWTGGNPLHSWGKPYAPATFADDATNLDLAANPNSDEMIFASVGDGAKTAGTAALQIGYWNGAGWTNNANVDTSCQQPLAGTKLVAAGWLTSVGTTRWVVAYNDANATSVGWYYGTTGTPTLGTPASVAPLFASPQKYYDIKQDPLNKDRLIFTVSDNASDLIAKRLVMTSVPAFTWTDANGGTALETNLASATAGGYSFGFWPAPPSSTFVQSAYRFFANNAASTDVGAPLAAQDSLALLGAAGTPFRLRTLLHVGQVNFPANGQPFKLQFAGRGEGTCDAPLNGTPAAYTDVTAATVIAFKDNTPNDNTALTANAQDPKHGTHLNVNQTYEELNNFTNSQSAIAASKDGMWDFALTDNGMTPGTSYCLRVSSGDGSPLNGYDVYPEVVLPAAVSVNEVYPSSNTTGTDGWVELFNNSKSTPTLIGWKVNYVQGAIGSENSPTTLWTGTSADSVNAMSTYTITGLTLNAAGYHVKLLDNAGNIVDQVQWPGLSVGQSFARITDGNPGLFEIDPTPTKNYANYVDTDALKINEVSYGALGGQFIELYNASSVSTRTLTGYSLRNSKGLLFKFTRKIYPLNYTVLDFSSTGSDGAPYAGVSGAFGQQGLSASGDFLTLENSTGSTVDQVTWQADAATGFSRYNYRAELVSAGTGNFALGNSTVSISRQPTEGAETGSDSADFVRSTFTTVGSRNNNARTAAANLLAYPLNAAAPQFLARKFPLTLTFGTRSSTGTANTVIFTRTGGSDDFRSPHIYRLADIGFNLDTLTSQTTVQTGFSFNDQDGYPLVSSAAYRVVFNTDTGTKSAPQIILGTVTYGTAIHTVTASTAAPLWLNSAAKGSAIKLEISNNSPAGFGSLEVTTVTFTLLDSNGLATLDTGKARNLFNAIMLVKDSTSAGTIGLYESGIDVSSIAYVPMSSISLDSNSMSTLTVLSPDLPSAAVPAASTGTFYVVFEATQNASGWVVPDNVFRVRLNPQGALVRDGPSDLLQEAVLSAQVETSSITLIEPARPPANTAWPYTLPPQAVSSAPVAYYTFDPDPAYATTPAVSSAVYVGASDGYLRAVKNDGTLKWEYPLPGNSPVSMSPSAMVEGPAGSAGLYLYVPADNGHVYKLRDNDTRADAVPGWDYDAKAVPTSNLLCSDVWCTGTKLYFGASDSKVHCVNKADGTPCDGWPVAVGVNAPVSAPMVIDERVNLGWVGLADGNIVALQTVNKDLPSSFKSSNLPVKSAPILDAYTMGLNNTLYFASSEGKLYARNSSNLQTPPAGWPNGATEPEQDYHAGAPINTSPYMDWSVPRNIYFGDDAGKLHKVNAATGLSAPGWPFQAGGRIRSSPVVVNYGAGADYVYFGCDDGYIYAIKASDGSRRTGWPVYAGAPVNVDVIADPDNQTLIATSADGRVHVLYIGP